jgi:hypothetical protein
MSSANNGAGAGGPPEEDEDDYMNMTFEEPTSTKETSLQRTQRLKQEARARGVIKSKAQIAEEEAAAREKALSTSMLEDPKATKSKGFAMMAKMGFTGGGLGRKTEDGQSQGRTEPIQLSLKDDRGGIGMDTEKKRRLREAAEEQGIEPDAKAPKLDPDEYRERVKKEREEAKLEKQFFAAQRMAERMDEEDECEAPTKRAGSEDSDSEEDESKGNKPKPTSSRLLKSIPILYRGLARHRDEQERERRMRHDLEQSLSRLPTYEDDDEDDDYKKALGKRKTVYVTADDLDEEDPELDEFNALDVRERLERLLKYLREKHRYCFWCKMTYSDEDMEGCPGLTEEEHD